MAFPAPLSRLRQRIGGPSPTHRLLDLLERRKVDLFRQYGIATVLDVGANIGQYARRLRSLGYGGRIVSFEPQRKALGLLTAAADSDPGWEVVESGLGDRETVADLNITENGCSSSLLDPLPRHVQAAPGARCVDQAPVAIRRLDDVLPELNLDERPVHLKIDTQGYELRVLEGATRAVERMQSIEVELSLVPLYEHGPLFEDVCAWLTRRGFRPVFVAPAFIDPATGEWLQG